MKQKKRIKTGLIGLVLAMVFVLNLSGCGSRYVEGSEKTYYGIVTDCGMSVVNEGDREGRPYIIIATADEEVICFWLEDFYTYSAGVGSTVTIESTIEEGTNLLVARKITVDDACFGFPRKDFTVVEEQDTHGGFHGDGTYYLILDCSENREKALEYVANWKKFPLTENLNRMVYEHGLAKEANIPEITNGYYYFCDRHSESVDSRDDTNLFQRSSYNFSLAIYDSDIDRLYYVEFDT